MKNLNVIKFFSEEDKLFNLEMVNRSLCKTNDITVSDLMSTKIPISDLFILQLYQDRQYDFTSEILGEFRKKWGIE